MVPATRTHSPACAGLAARLDGGELFSDLAASVAGGRVTCGALRRFPAGPLDPREQELLEVWRDGLTTGLRRRAVMRDEAGRDVARVMAVYLPSRIASVSALRSLWETDAPLGGALAALGVTRRSLGARQAADGAVILRSSGVLLLPGDDGDLVPVALASEALLRGALTRGGDYPRDLVPLS